MAAEIRSNLYRNPTEPAPPTRGRPRSERVDRAILDAAGDLLVERGFDGLRLDLVAERARVGKAAVRRRFRGRSALAVALLRATGDHPPESIEIGGTRGALTSILDGIAERIDGTRRGAVLRTVLGELATDPELRAAVRAIVDDRWRAPIVQLLERGVAVGELRRDLDAAITTDALVGTLLLRLVVGETLDHPLIERLVRTIVDANLTSRTTGSWVTLA